MRKSKRFIASAICSAVGICMASCTASKRPSRVERALANAAKDVVIPIEAQNLKNPTPNTTIVIEQGRQIYNQTCALCHGSDGHGRTNLGLGMYPPVMDLTSPHVQHWTDAELFWIVENGVRLTGMPSFQAVISADDTWKLARLIHALPRLDAAASAGAPSAPAKIEQDRVAYGRKLYRQEGCFMCHRLNGEGGKVGPDLTTEGTRGRTDAWLIGHFRNPGAYTKGSIMPPFENATNDQLRALTAFLQAQKGQNDTAEK
jgi:mono/diheme cytochrome c family protein